jgi:hypothetical protein
MFSLKFNRKIRYEFRDFVKLNWLNKIDFFVITYLAEQSNDDFLLGKYNSRKELLPKKNLCYTINLNRLSALGNPLILQRFLLSVSGCGTNRQAQTLSGFDRTEDFSTGAPAAYSSQETLWVMLND